MGETTTPRKTGCTGIAVDLAKSVFEVAVSLQPGPVRFRRRLRCGALLEFFVLAAAYQQREPDAVRAWAVATSARLGHNKAAVALATQLARFARAVATRDTRFEVRPLAA